MSNVVTPALPSRPSGIGGWLILVAIGLILSPIRLLLTLAVDFLPLFTDGTWEALTTTGSEVYHPLWAPIILGEVAGNIGFLGTGIALLVLFFMESRSFPTLFIAVAFINLAFIVGDALVVSVLVPDVPVFDAETTREIARSLFAVAVWVPYMLVSKRVKNTFVR